MRTLSLKPENVCSREMIVTLDDDDTILNLRVIGGCPGNLQGISRLVKGRKKDEIICLLKGIRCPGSRTRDTSCPDQLATLLSKISD